VPIWGTSKQREPEVRKKGLRATTSALLALYGQNTFSNLVVFCLFLLRRPPRGLRHTKKQTTTIFKHDFGPCKAGSAELVSVSKPYCRKTVSYHPILCLHVFLLELGVPRPKTTHFPEPRVLLALKPSVARPTNHSLIGNVFLFLRWYPKTPKNHLANNVRARL
jgi:hypothetical protein